MENGNVHGIRDDVVGGGYNEHSSIVVRYAYVVSFIAIITTPLITSVFAYVLWS